MGERIERDERVKSVGWTGGEGAARNADRSFGAQHASYELTSDIIWVECTQIEDFRWLSSTVT